MPMASRRKRARPSSSSLPRSTPATTTRPALGRSRPPVTIIKVDLPEPDGPTRLTVSPAPTRSETPRRTLTGPAALVSVRRTSSSKIIGSSERGGACMSPLIVWERPGCLLGRRILRRYGDVPAVVNIANRVPAFSLIALLSIGVATGARGEAQASPRVLALGDSLTAGFGLSPKESFPARLQAKLAAAGVDAQVVNGGISGHTSAGGLARLDWALAHHPHVVPLELGANDAPRGIDPRATYANLDKILTPPK